MASYWNHYIFVFYFDYLFYMLFFNTWISFKLELEQQKIQEEQENAPEFVKVKGNLRRTVKEAAEAPDS